VQAIEDEDNDLDYLHVPVRVAIPSFRSEDSSKKEALPRPFEYDFYRISPIHNTPTQAILCDELYIFVKKYNLLIKRYAILNQMAFILYKNKRAFENNPDKPLAIVPLHEIHRVLFRQFDTNKIMKLNQRNAKLGSEDLLQVMTIDFKRNYHTFVRLVWNFEYKNVEDVGCKQPMEKSLFKQKAQR